ncbi:YjcB family protein [Serratia bockelmannii]|uniref:YjcB family protein n=1 Tax=Serratia bockelmannii TaxID=2703793 RepID=UPI00313EBD21
MSTIATGLAMMRWELLSAVMMFFASQLNVVCRKTSRNGMAFMFSSLGLFTACWFVMGLMGIHLTLEAFTQFWSSAWDRYVDVVSTMPADWPMP